MNLKTTYRKEGKQFTKISRDVTTNNDLSIIEIGLITKLLSYTDAFVIHKETEQRTSGVGEIVYKKAWANLEKKGFIESTKTRDQGKYIYHYTISDSLMNEDTTNGKQEMVKHQRETIGDNQEVVNGRRLTGGDNLVLNREVSIIELNNKELSNKEVIKEKVINVDETTLAVNDINKLNNYNIIEETTDILLKHIDNDTSIYEGNSLTADDSTIGNFSIDEEGKLNYPSMVLEPALKQVQNQEKVEKITFSSVQDEVKHLFREYVIDNRIHPFFIEREINEIYELEEFVSNIDNCTVGCWWELIHKVIKLEKFHNSNQHNSVYSQFKRKIDEYIKFNDIDKEEAYSRTKNFLLEQPIDINAKMVTKQMFDYFLNKSKIYALSSKYK